MSQEYPPAYFVRRDETTDFNFYAIPRKVVHIDDGAIEAVRTLYAELLPENGIILDLMSSWRSHLPEEKVFQHVTGLGMVAEEMADNPQLNEYLVHSLNDDPQLPFEDEQFDAAVCAVSVQYLTQPLAVFTQVNRVLKPGSPFVVSFSNRCFPTKAVAIWLNNNDEGHIQLVHDYFKRTGGWGTVDIFRKQGGLFRGDPLYALWAKKIIS